MAGIFEKLRRQISSNSSNDDTTPLDNPTTLIGIPGPTTAQLESLVARIRKVLQKAGNCQQKDVDIYLALLQRASNGLWEPGRVRSLSKPALEQGSAILLIWQAWLAEINGAPLPSNLERLVLSVNGRLQSLLKKPTVETKPEQQPLAGIDTLPELFASARAHTEVERMACVFHIEFPTHLPSNTERVMQAANLQLTPLLRENDASFLIDRHTLGLVCANLAGEGHAILAAHRIQTIFETPVQVDGSSLQLHPRIGIAQVGDDASKIDDLLAAAAVAARQFASEGIGFYQPERDLLSKLLLRLENPLRNAIANNHLHLAFQPQIRQKDGMLYGLESLLRWQDPVLGNIPPADIVKVAEHLGLMPPLTHWIVQTTLREFSRLMHQGIPGCIGINLSPYNLRDKGLAAMITDVLNLWQIPGDRVVLEITETALIEDIDQAIIELESLRKIGCKLSLDDFGTGYSSLSYLRRLPIDELKIDASFIQGLCSSNKDVGIVTSIIDLAHRLGLTVIAEGVEDAATAQILGAAGNDIVQGFFYSTPIAPDAIPAFYASLNQATASR